MEDFEAAFKAMLGDPRSTLTGQTPSEIIYTENKLRLLHYLPVANKATPLCEVPLLIVPSLLYRYSILDLAPSASLVGYLVEHGIDVYLLDWGTPGREYRYITFDYYITG